MGQISVIQVFIQFCNGFIYRTSQKVDLGGHGEGLGHFQLAGVGTLQGRCCNSLFFYRYEIVNIRLHSHNSTLYEEVAPGIRQCIHNSFQIHGNDLYGISFFQFLGIHGLLVGRLLLVITKSQFSVLFVDLVTDLLSLFL